MYPMRKRYLHLGGSAGFSLPELLVVMGIMTGVLIITATAFKSILTASSREMRVAESQVADVIGLELLRIDLEQTGYGIPSSYQQAITYSEAVSASNTPVTGKDPADFNLPLATGSTTLPPRPLAGGVNNGYFNNTNSNAPFNGSDYLVIRSSVNARNVAGQKWTYVVTGEDPKISDVAAENLLATEKVLVLRPSFRPTFTNQLVMQSATAFYAYSTNAADASYWRKYMPVEPTEKRLIYGLVDAGVTPRMPFNRSDYYVRRPAAASDMPQRCAQKTGILYKAIVNNTTGTGGGGLTEIPLMDCVADFQVVYGLDSNEDGALDTYTDVNGLEALDVGQIRRRVKEIWSFILTHEGIADRSYSYPNTTVLVGANIWGADRGKTFDLQGTIGDNATTGFSWRNYRWKLYRFVVRPKNLN
jgi:type II secretory pathway pseudopilin PulG